MDRQQAINILNNPKSTKAALQYALSFALGVEYEPDTKEKQQTVFNQCQRLFCDSYTKETNGLIYVFEGKDGKALKELIDKLQTIIKTNSSFDIVHSFNMLITNLPDWYKQNAFSLSVINKKFNEIIASINKNGKANERSGISQSYKDRIRNGL